MRYHAPLSSKGQITIPKLIREKLALVEGDTVVFVPTESGILTVPRNKSVESVFGILSAHAMPGTSVEDYDTAVRDGVAEHVEGERHIARDDAA